MELSVIIVSFNVRDFLRQCLISVKIASEKINYEILVVDNNSEDGSVEMVKNDFPEVKLIINRVNWGFSVANNQAIKMSGGHFILLLNPDTLVERDTFSRCIEVKLIINRVNWGFSVANNQAIKMSGGHFILLLNPDTIVERDTFSRCIEFM